MKTIKQMLDDRAVIKEQMSDLINKAKAENREFTPEEDKQWDEMHANQEKLVSQITRLKQAEAIAAESAEPIPEPVKKDKEEVKAEVFDKYLRKGTRGMTDVERNVLSQMRGTDPQTVGTDSAGGYLSPQGFSNELYKSMAHWGGMMDEARIVKTATGNTIDWPTLDDTATTGAILAEGTAETVSDMTFGNKQLGAYMYTSKPVKLSVQLLQDSYFNLPEELKPLFGRRLGTIMNAHFTTGTGSGQPNGFVTGATVGTTSASNSAITRSELVTLQHSVNRAYRNNAKFAFNDTTLSLIKKLALGSGDARPLWQPSVIVGEPDKLEGHEYFVNPDMASFGAGNKPIAFGDFSKYIIRLAGDPTFVRLDERYMDALLVGFIAYQRADGELLDSAAIKTLRNPTT